MRYAQFIVFLCLFWLFVPQIAIAASPTPLWEVQSIDTMKYSRDIAREKLHDNTFTDVIEKQIGLISQTGATHVSIATPYDEEFLPFLRRWVDSARKHNLRVWFRGNFSGWENWFGYSDISRSEHLELTQNFILEHPNLFSDGDIFTPCPECENGGPGDPRLTGDVGGFRQFTRDLYRVCSSSFAQIKKDVACNYFSSNGDVAKLIFDVDTAAAIGGIITIDHYVRTPNQLITDIKNLASRTGAKIVLGEFGAPIPDIHGQMSPAAQADWLAEVLANLARTPEVIGLNYWTSFGSSTALWNESSSPRPAVAVLTSFYSPPTLTLTVKNAAGQPLSLATASLNGRVFSSNKSGRIFLPLISTSIINISAPDYHDHGLQAQAADGSFDIILDKVHENWLFKLRKLTYRLFNSILP